MRDLRVWITAAVLFLTPLSAFASGQAGIAGEYVPGEAVVVVEAGTSANGLTAMEFSSTLSSAAAGIASAAGGESKGITAAIASVTGKNIILVKSAEKSTEELLSELRKTP